MKKGLIITLIVAASAATCWKAFKNEFGRGDVEEGLAVVSSSLERARKDGILIAALEAEPSEVAFGDTKFLIQEAWIEKYAVHRFPLIWLHRRVPAGGFVVAIRLTTSDSRLTLWPETAGGSYTSHGAEFHTCYYEEQPKLPLTILVSRGRDHIPVFKLKKAADHSAAFISSDLSASAAFVQR